MDIVLFDALRTVRDTYFGCSLYTSFLEGLEWLVATHTFHDFMEKG